jgi:hypothetical protein
MDSIDDNDTKDLRERSTENSKLSFLVFVFAALSVVMAIYSAYSIIYFTTDRSVPLVACPRNFVLDAPVLMKTIREETPIVQDRWIRGFTRRFIEAQFPRTGLDVKPFFSYVSTHSDGDVHTKFSSLLEEHVEVEHIVSGGSFYRFYPKHVELSSSAVRIRAVTPGKEWVVEVDGYLVKKMGQVTERFTPTLRYTVESKKPTIENPEGLYVTEGTIEQITDYVSETKEKL